MAKNVIIYAGSDTDTVAINASRQLGTLRLAHVLSNLQTAKLLRYRSQEDESGKLCGVYLPLIVSSQCAGNSKEFEQREFEHNVLSGMNVLGIYGKSSRKIKAVCQIASIVT